MKLASFLLRVGLAAVFGYAAVSSLLQPESWMGFLPQFLRTAFPEQILLIAFSVYELILALWLLSAWKVQWSASLAALTTLSILVFNIAALDILFRDIAIFFSALALVSLHKSNQPPEMQ